MERRLVSQLVAAVTAKLAAGAGSNFVPRLTSGTVTDAGTRPTVVLDSTGTAVQANCAGDAPGPGERVWVFQVLGQSVVVGRRGGSQRLLGYATDTSDDPFTAQETLGGLAVVVVVNQPGRVIRLSGAAQISVDTNNGVVIGEFTWDGVDTGRFFRHLFPTAGVAEFGSGFSYVVDPEPGAHTVTMDGTATGATGTFLGATSPGYLLVEDIGPIGGTMA